MKYPLFMMAADVAEAPPAGKTSFGDKFAAAMAKETPAPDAPVVTAPAVDPVKDEPAKPDPVKPTEPAKPKADAKPKNALDALLSTKPDDKTPAPVTDDDPLKEFPLDSKEKNWAGLRKKAEDGWARAKELESKVGQPDPKTAEEIETLRGTLTAREQAIAEMEAKMAEYKDAMTAVNIELDPDYRREFIDGRKQLVASAGAKFKAYGGNPEELAEALALPEGRRKDEVLESLLSDLGDTARAKILNSIAAVETLDEKRAAVLASPQASFEELQRKHTAAQAAQAEQAESFKKAEFDRTLRELSKTMPTLGVADESLEGGKEWNAARAENNARALALLSNDATPQQVIAASIKAADYDRLAGMVIEARKTIAEQAAQLAEYSGAMPDAKGRRAPALTPAEERAKMTPGERYAAGIASGKADDF